MSLQLIDSIARSDWGLDARGEFVSFFGNLLVGRPGNSAALVLDADGRDRDAAGVSRGISNELDRCFLVTLRNRSSMVITTGATIRAEGLHFPASGHIGILSREASLEVPRITGKGQIFRVIMSTSDWTGEPLSVTSKDDSIHEAQGPQELAAVTAKTDIHFETGLRSLSLLWNAREIDQLWVSHAPSTELHRHFHAALVTGYAQLGSLRLSLLQPRS